MNQAAVATCIQDHEGICGSDTESGYAFELAAVATEASTMLQQW
jgi:hypothetical protein